MIEYLATCSVLIPWIVLVAGVYFILSSRKLADEPEVEEQWIRVEGDRISVWDPTKEERDRAARNDVA